VGGSIIDINAIQDVQSVCCQGQPACYGQCVFNQVIITPQQSWGPLLFIKYFKLKVRYIVSPYFAMPVNTWDDYNETLQARRGEVRDWLHRCAASEPSTTTHRQSSYHLQSQRDGLHIQMSEARTQADGSNVKRGRRQLGLQSPRQSSSSKIPLQLDDGDADELAEDMSERLSVTASHFSSVFSHPQSKNPGRSRSRSPTKYVCDLRHAKPPILLSLDQTQWSQNFKKLNADFTRQMLSGVMPWSIKVRQ
jgi:hypothetical protein